MGENNLILISNKHYLLPVIPNTFWALLFRMFISIINCCLFTRLNRKFKLFWMTVLSDLDEEHSQRPQQGEADTRQAARKTACRQPADGVPWDLNNRQQEVVYVGAH